MEPGLVVAAVMRRADARDVFVSARGTRLGLDELPRGSRVGTSSLRRRSLLLERRPDLSVEDLRGNLDTRLDALDRDGGLDGAVLARAGLLRLGRADAAAEILEPPAWLPAAGQGALAVVTRAGDTRMLELAHQLDHEDTRVCVMAERALLRQLQGGCQVPIGALATLEHGSLSLAAFVGSVDGRRIVRGHWSGAAADAEAGGAALAAQLERDGGRAIIDELRDATTPLAGPSAP
jgi:hydroxymethylbilane synthase